MPERRGGVLLHITSLPGSEAVGTLGRSAFDFVDFLARAGMRVWQVLPIGPTGYGESPYQSTGCLAGNPLLIDLSTLQHDGYLPQDLPLPSASFAPMVDFAALRAQKEPLLRRAFAHSKAAFDVRAAFAELPWLHDYALFMAIKSHFDGKSWMEWPDTGARLRKKAALRHYEATLREEIAYHAFLQVMFRRQWLALKRYANAQGIALLGDMPIYAAEDSADVWANAHLFQLDRARHPTAVAGVPPDYFSQDGQLWGNPLYRWHKMRLLGYGWWLARLRGMGELFDQVRIDHFIGFANYYAVPAGEKTARNGHWVIGPGKAFFRTVQKKCPNVSVIAEDLGAVNARVRALLSYCGYPGMKVLQFAFGGGEENPHRLENFVPNCVAYTGTHDNDTTLGWWQAADAATRADAEKALGPLDDSSIAARMLQAVFDSPADTAIAPMQDFLSQGNACRMNLPGTVGGTNWRYRLDAQLLTPALAARMRQLNISSRRTNEGGSHGKD